MSDETGREETAVEALHNDLDAAEDKLRNHYDRSTAPTTEAKPIEEWRKESADGAVYLIEHNGNEYYFITPTRAKFKRFVDNAMKSSFDAMFTLLIDCVKHPDVEALHRSVEASPQLVSVLANSFTKALGIDQEATIKKV